jgi:hypothetical protein
MRTTNCPLILACCGLGTVVTSSGHFHAVVTFRFRIQSVFLLLIKYTHDYPQLVIFSLGQVLLMISTKTTFRIYF